MIEAVKSTVANAELLRGNIAQTGTDRSFAANPSRLQEVPAEPVRAPFISPVVHVDVNTNQAVLQYRESETGDVVREIPSQNRTEELRRSEGDDDAAAVAQAQEARTGSNASDTGVVNNVADTGGNAGNLGAATPAPQSVDLLA